MQRVNVPKLESEAYRALLTLERANSKSKLPEKYKQIIRVRASYINGCAYCIDMHTRDAKKAGETDQRLYALCAWHESPLFSDEERAMLALIDEVTMISGHGVSDEVYENAAKFIDEKLIADMIMMIGVINYWNRIAISTHEIYTDKTGKKIGS